jgi:arylsulfatase A-like enzyme
MWLTTGIRNTTTRCGRTVGSPGTVTAPRGYLTGVISRKATRFIERAAGSGRPFLLEVATFAPHRPATPAPRDVNKFRRLKAPHTRSFNKPVAHASRWLRTVPALSRAEVSRMDERFRGRVRSVQAVDRMVGRLRRQLRALGLARNTYFVFSSDNGFHLGEHRLRPGKRTAFDTDIRVPLIVAGPGVPAGRRVTAMTASIDLCPTFEEIAGLRPGKRVDGISMLRLWHGRKVKHPRKAVLVEHHNSDGRKSNDPDYQANRHGDPPDYAAIRTRRALYVEYADGEREYYNLRKDPAELNNRVRRVPKAKLVTIRARLHAMQRCHTAASCRRAASR